MISVSSQCSPSAINLSPSESDKSQYAVPVISILALGAAVAHAAPAPLPAAGVSGSSRFSVPAVHNANYVRNGTAALLKAYAKYNLKPTREMPRAFTEALSKRQDGSVPAIPSDGVEYLVPVTIGGESLNLDFDTGSSDLWVFSSLLPSNDLSGHEYYTSSSSKTYKALSGYTWSISYGDGSSASGTVGTDTVTVGGTTVTSQAVELAKKISSAFVQDAADGLLGLAFSSINTVKPVQQKTFFDNAQSSLDSPLFAAYLPNNADGAYDFGYTDSSKYTGTIQYAAVSDSGGFWEYPSTSYKVGSTTYSQSGFTAISDTGTTLILMGDTVVTNYYAKVSGASYDSSQGGYTFPCSATLPSLSFLIGPTYYATVPGSLLNFGVASGSTCFGGLQSVGGGSQNIYGDVFFNAYYGVFDASGPQFGFAPAVAPGSTPPPASSTSVAPTSTSKPHSSTTAVPTTSAAPTTSAVPTSSAIPTSTTSTTPTPSATGGVLSGKGFFEAYTSGKQQGCLVSAMTWYEGGTCATYTATPKGSGFTLSTSRGSCGVYESEFTCGYGISSTFTVINGYLAYHGSTTFYADETPYFEQEAVFTTPDSVQVKFLWQPK